VPGALIISATVRNDADFAQAFPVVEITLSDLDETRIAMRRFQPRDYVNDARTIAGGLAPGASTALVFEVADPGRNAVAFEFKFDE
jgi:glyoxylate carboligase